MHMPKETSEKRETAGEVLPDGTVLEPIRDPATEELRLLHWDGGPCNIAQRIVHNGIEYRPVDIDPGISLAPFVPSRVGPEEPPDKLLRDIYDLCKRLQQPKASTLKLTLLPPVSWLSGALSMSPLASIVA